ncbi:MAG: HAD hydrolase-like protein [Nitrosopumilus sp.]|nr:HAD hydrolase-like protein [Nitrosopumilus sp.]
MSLKLAVFDMAGTTVLDNNYVSNAFINAFNSQYLKITKSNVDPLMGYHKPTAIKMVLEKYAVDYDENLIKIIHQNFEEELLDFYAYDAGAEPMEFAEDIFLFFKERGVKIALNTGFSKDIATTIVNRFQWMERGLVDDFIASDEVKRGRPFPDMINTLKKRLHINNDETVMKVGDTVVDILEGEKAGCEYNIAVTTGATTREELENYEPTHIISNLSQLPPLFNFNYSLHV